MYLGVSYYFTRYYFIIHFKIVHYIYSPSNCITNLIGVAASGELQSERLLLARPSISAVGCILDYVLKYLLNDSCVAKSTIVRLSIVLAGCAQRSILSINFEIVYTLKSRFTDSLSLSSKTSYVGFTKSTKTSFKFISFRIVFFFVKP